MPSLFEKVIIFINGVQKEYYSVPADQLIELGIVGRLKLYDWSLEIFAVVIIGVIVALFNLGVQWNQSKINGWLKAVQPVLEENFAQVGVKKDQLLVKDTAQLFTSYATGRINISGLTARFSLISRQNLFTHLVELSLSTFTGSIPAPVDEVEVVIDLHDAEKLNKYIFAIVNKEGMSKARDDHYYLSLTKTTESSNIPVEYVFMSESTELNENLVTEELKDALAKSAGFLKFLAVTDLPSEKPTTETEFISRPTLKLKLALKSDSKSLAAAKVLIEEFIALADRVAKFNLKAEQQKKINNVRAAELGKIQKATAELKAAELREAKIEAERKARRESTLSPEEQDKADQKKREKKERRAKNKMVKRM